MPYLFTIVISAFLVFQVQPVIAKFILPWFGGTPSVWTASLLFFQMALLAGYGYAHLIVRYLSVKNQVLTHLGLLLFSIVLLPVTPSEAFKPDGAGSPFIDIIILLTATVGVPYLLISATGPLLQSWYSKRYKARSPYRLYALSNAGSIFGLLSYPFLFEPFFKLNTQTWMWSGAYLLYICFCGWAGYHLLSFLKKEGKTLAESSKTAIQSKLKAGQVFIWLGLAACGSLFLLAITNKITQDIAPIPFLWIIPLTLYLITFIIAFDSPRWYNRKFWIPLFFLSVATIIGLLFWDDDIGMITQVAGYAGSMFFICMTCHGELARQKPPAERLTAFYLLVSAGGAVGGLFVNLFAPYVLNGYWELHIGLVVAMILVGYSLARFRQKNEAAILAPIKMPIKVAFMLFLFTTCGFLIHHVKTELDEVITSRRNFYGILGVYDKNPGTEKHVHSLFHGNITHGLQFWSEDKRHIPTTYYARHSGIGVGIRRHPRREQNRGLKVGIVGLGAGTIATYCKKKDYFRFYEINPVSYDLAKEHFTFLEDAKGKVEVIIGDARIMMEKELEKSGSQNYDVIAVDAFSGDAVPLHLLTKEAFALYFEHLKEDGILAIHISNRYVELMPVVRGQANLFGYTSVKFKTNRKKSIGRYRTTWVLVTNNQVFLENPNVKHYIRTWDNDQEDVIWTDDFSNLANILTIDFGF